MNSCRVTVTVTVMNWVMVSVTVEDLVRIRSPVVLNG